MQQDAGSSITVTVASARVGLSPRVVGYCVEVGIVSEELTEGDLEELRRVRRLRELGVNLAGVEIILRMRQRIVKLESEVERCDWWERRDARA